MEETNAKDIGTIELETIQKRISEYIKKKKNKDVVVNVFRDIPKTNNAFVMIKAAMELQKAVDVYNFIEWESRNQEHTTETP